MTETERETVLVLLACDALEATDSHAGDAVMLLIDAAMAILVTRHAGAEPRRDIAVMLSGYVVEHVDAIIAATEDPQ